MFINVVFPTFTIFPFPLPFSFCVVLSWMECFSRWSGEFGVSFSLLEVFEVSTFGESDVLFEFV